MVHRDLKPDKAFVTREYPVGAMPLDHFHLSADGQSYAYGYARILDSRCLVDGLR